MPKSGPSKPKFQVFGKKETQNSLNDKNQEVNILKISEIDDSELIGYQHTKPAPKSSIKNSKPKTFKSNLYKKLKIL